MTDPRPESDSAAPKRRGLWSVMGAPVPPVEPGDPAPVDAAAIDTPNDQGEGASVDVPRHDSPPASQDTAAAPRQRGLWSMMPQAPTAEPATPAAVGATDDGDSPARTAEPAVGVESSGTAAPAPAGRGLFALMQRGVDSEPASKHAASDRNPGAVRPFSHHVNVDERDVVDPERERDRFPPEEAAVDSARRDDEDVFEDDADPVTLASTSEARERSAIDPINLEDLEPPSYRRAADAARKQARWGLAAGFLSMLASALAVLPQFAAGVPAPLLGFVAIILGYLVLTGSGRRELSLATRTVTLLGMGLGVSGIFLGPLIFAGLGRTWRETGSTVTGVHLAQIGTGLDACYDKTGGYPVGGLFARDDSGTIRGQHGWMTALLPFVGEAELHRQIDFAQPYDAEVNRSVMGTSVGVYFAAGADRARIGNGFAVSHFAGLGGEVDDGSGLAHLGIFERDVAVKRDEVTDGLSNTLIVGELGGTFPPWGDPENWRKIGRGLNREIDGFGSATGKGATFLLGDGSVKFFSNKTDPRLLLQMSTRNGGD